MVRKSANLRTTSPPMSTCCQGAEPLEAPGIPASELWGALLSLPATELFCMNSETERLCKAPERRDRLQRKLPQTLRVTTSPSEGSWPSHGIWRLVVTTPLPSWGDDTSRTRSLHYHILDITKATYSPFFSRGSPSQPLGATPPSLWLPLEKDAGTSGWY